MPPFYTCTTLFLFLLVAVRFPSGGAAPSIVDQFEKWILDNNVHYVTKAEKDARFIIFKSNVEFIDAFNGNPSNKFQLEVNQFADLTLDEFNEMISAEPPPMTGTLWNNTDFRHENVDLMESVDWRTTGGVTPAKDQGRCGACWAFAAAALMEAINYSKTGTLLTLSEQQFMDCSRKKPDEPRNSCKGGRPNTAFKHAVENGGIALAQDYPYTERGTDRCNPSLVGHNAPITGYQYGPKNDEAALKYVISITPVAFGMIVGSDEFRFHGGDRVFNINGGDCGKTWHYMALIGYGVEPDGTKYWLVKNSWGTGWGVDGFGKIAREAPGVGPSGMCSMATFNAWPVWLP